MQAAKDGEPLRNFANHPKSLTYARASMASLPVNIVVPKNTGRTPLAAGVAVGGCQGDPEVPGVPSEFRLLPSHAWILVVNFILPWGSIVAYFSVDADTPALLDSLPTEEASVHAAKAAVAAAGASFEQASNEMSSPEAATRELGGRDGRVGREG